MRVCAANLNARGVTFDFRETDLKKLVTVWDSRLEANVPLAVLPTRTHGSIIDPDRADKDNQEKIQESPEEQRQLGELVLQALGCRDFDEYQSIHAAWDAIAEQRVPVHLEGDQTKRWLKRNTTHFVQIVIPRMPNANVFRLTNLTDAK